MINLLSLEEKRNIRREYHLRILSVCLPLFSVVLVLSIIALAPAFFFSVNSYNSILKESQSEKVVNRKMQEAQMISTVSDVNKKISLLNQNASALGAWDALNEVLKTKSKGISVTSFSFESAVSNRVKSKSRSNTIILDGYSENRDAITSYTNLLKTNKDFTLVDLPISSLVSESNFPYHVNISVKE